NYTAYVVQDETKLAGPVYFTTKSSLFTCSLVHSLPYCPNIAYSIPLPQPQAPAPAFHDASSIPDTISNPIIEYLTNFTTALTTFACGRDEYSPIMGCDDCQRQYRKWLCLVSFVRCGEPSPSSTTTTSSSVATQTDGAQSPLS